MFGKGVVIGMLACGLSYLLYIPFPEESDLPLAMKAVRVLSKAIFSSCQIVEAFGGNHWAPLKFLDFPPPVLKGVTVREVSDFAGIPVIIIEPEDVVRKTPAGAIIFYHGGGWVFGSMGTHGTQVMTMVKKLGLMLVMPMYRVAPEHPFPVGFNDCLHFTKEFMNRASEFNVDPRKIVAMGDSAGGNLAVAVALALADEDPSGKTPDFCMMSLFDPVLQMSNFLLPSYRQNWNPVTMPPEILVRFILSYMGLHNRTELVEPMLLNLHAEGLGKNILGRTSDNWIPARYKTKVPSTFDYMKRLAVPELRKRMDKYKTKIQSIVTDISFAPLTADDARLGKLPYMNIITSEHDAIRDDGIILHERMKSLGKAVTHTNLEFASHGLVTLYGLVSYKKLDDEMDKLFKTIQARLREC